jgi:hypothetical protein
MEMPKPTDAHRKMERLAGEWIGEETMYPSPWDPKGGVASARSQSRVALDGFALVADYEQQRDGVVTFQGHGVYTYDAKERCYLLHWFDSIGGPAEVFRGQFDGDVLTLTSRNPQGFARMTWDLSGKGRMKSRMEMSQDGKSWAALFDGVYTRKG